MGPNGGQLKALRILFLCLYDAYVWHTHGLCPRLSRADVIYPFHAAYLPILMEGFGPVSIDS